MRIIFALFLSLAMTFPAAIDAKTFVTRRTDVVVKEVVDGDTVTVTKDKRKLNVRLLFIDTMESRNNAKLNRDILKYAGNGVQVRKKDMLALGKLATIYLRSLLKPGDSVTLESFQGNERDRYGRLLAVVHRKGANINLQMVREGYARVYFIGKVPSNIRTQYQAEENAARNGRKVIWNYLR